MLVFLLWLCFHLLAPIRASTPLVQPDCHPHRHKAQQIVKSLLRYVGPKSFTAHLRESLCLAYAI